MFSIPPSFQLPLSGSLEKRSLRAIKVELEAFNSLSRDHTFLRFSDFTKYTPAFNSLSRDHILRLRVGLFTLCIISFNSLSLGITYLPKELELAVKRLDFQLPLSGSLKWEGERARVMYWTFNSLSRDHNPRIASGRAGHHAQARLSTPSLGITKDATQLHQMWPRFQLPLSGSQFPIVDDLVSHRNF